MAPNVGTLNVRGITENCHNCRRPSLCNLDFKDVSALGGTCNSSIGVTLNTAYGYLKLDVRHYFVIELMTGLEPVYLETLTLKEHSTHTLVVRQWTNGSVGIELVEDFSGDNIWIPLIVAVCICVGLAVVYTVTTCIWSTSEEGEGSEDANGKSKLNLQVRPQWRGCVTGCTGLPDWVFGIVLVVKTSY